VAATGLAAGTSYHWQARVVDANGSLGDWASFGANLETDADVLITSSANTAPSAPSGAGQFRSDGTTAISAGGSTNESTVVFIATPSDPDGDGVRLLLELRPQATAFTGTATHVGVFGATSIEVSGLAAGGWHWQIAAEDAEGAIGAFTTPGGSPDFTVNTAANTNPSIPASVDQAEPPSSSIAVGGATQGTDVVFSGTVTDAEGSVRFEVEVRPVGTAFTGVPTASSAWVASGTPASVTVGGLAGTYHWQVRSADASGGVSAWASFGANAEADVDFEAAAAPPAPPPVRTKSKACGASEEGKALPIYLAVVVLLVVMRRWR
jgi:hypothetical protein